MTIQLPPFNTANVLVIGDILLDRYMEGQTERISPEAPVPVVHVRRIEDRPGGAGNVALNIKALGGNVTLTGIVGTDAAGYEIEALLKEVGVHNDFIKALDVTTITKLRVLSRHQQLIRLDFEEQIVPHHENELKAKFDALLPAHNAVILSDYGKGTLHDFNYYIEACQKKGVPVLVDPKRHFSYYRGATLITPNLKEFEAVVGPCATEHELEEKAKQVLHEFDLQGILVTRGAQGMMLVTPTSAPLHLPARALAVYDVTGAGDTVIGVFAACIAAGSIWKNAMAISNLAASIVVSKVGTATATPEELYQVTHQAHLQTQGVFEKEELLALVKLAQACGERIVMTNGCFDILHPGHVTYLEAAKALGTKLIVAVNDDASVKRLKGETRPINSVEHRMRVLAGLGAVDWVVPFSEDTPENLIQAIQPDVLVKGGDWKVDQIVGSAFVQSYGGTVQSLPFVEGYSTTKIVDQIMDQAPIDEGEK